jgi:uncharacterized protein (TIGR02147 family)
MPGVSINQSKAPDVECYTDFRKYLGDYYKWAKTQANGFSYQVFAARTGLTSKGFLFNVIAGKRNLSRSNTLGIISSLKFNKCEAIYFEHLVAFNQAGCLKERNHYYALLSSVKVSGKHPWKPQLVRRSQYEFYSRHYHSVIRSLIGLHPFKGDFNWLARRVRPRITPGQAKKSVELLESLGFVRRRKNGVYVLTERSIVTPVEVQSLAVANFHKQSGELAIRSIAEQPSSRRNITGVTIGISGAGYKKICEEIAEFRRKLCQIAEGDLNAKSVYQMNFQFFPVSSSLTKN